MSWRWPKSPICLPVQGIRWCYHLILAEQRTHPVISTFPHWFLGRAWKGVLSAHWAVPDTAVSLRVLICITSDSRWQAWRLWNIPCPEVYFSKNTDILSFFWLVLLSGLIHPFAFNLPVSFYSKCLCSIAVFPFYSVWESDFWGSIRPFTFNVIIIKSTILLAVFSICHICCLSFCLFFLIIFD